MNILLTISDSDAIKVIHGQGMPSFRHHDHGNLYIKFDVKFPQKDQLQNLDLLEKVLPPRSEQTGPPTDAMVEDFELENPENEHEQARAHGAATGMDEDDDDVPAGAERVQCASQ